MKFGRYLEETQIPEWKRAYIDFKGIKKRISAIRKAKQIKPPSPAQPSLLEEPRSRISYGSTSNNGNARIRSSSNIPEVTEITNESVATIGRRGKSDRSLARSYSEGMVEADGVSSVPRFLSTLTRRRSLARLKRKNDMTIESLYASLDPLEREFFSYLDSELEKVDKFYDERETAAVFRLTDFKLQLRELSEHRRIVHEIEALRSDAWNLPRVIGEVVGVTKAKVQQLDAQLGHHQHKHKVSGTVTPASIHEGPSHDPGEYQYAKRRMKKALREFYRGLELLNDYRVLNLTGFRKALKKYDKVCRQETQDLYFKEKINPRRFAFSETLNDAMREIENTYAAQFENDDRKQARKRLKSPGQIKSHYFSTFLSGLYLGVGLPLLISGIYNSFQPHIRQQIPEWGPLLEIYGTLMIFVVFSLLLGINILSWSYVKINYQFIFELDVRSAVDPRVYFEFPAFLFITLSFCVWLSFFNIGSSNIAPTTWPLVWLVFALVLLFNPFPVFSRSARAWLIKHVIHLLTAGTSPVEFSDFWLGDQFCSLAFSLAHLYTIGCAFEKKWDGVFDKCASSRHWATFALVSLPYFSRLVQSVRRYYDSRLPTHLVNAGKYGSSILMYVTYYVWRMRGTHHDTAFVVWCTFATLSSLYTSSWDLLMDWSFLSRRKPHPLLRPELIYTNNPLMYYFAIITNIIVRFIWVIYIPEQGLDRRVRAAIVAGLEMLRRFQWNFFRLENEQIGNTDQYRATREVPLPYSRRYRTEDEDDSDDDIEDTAADGITGNGKAPASLKMSKVANSLHKKSPTSGSNGAIVINDGGEEH